MFFVRCPNCGSEVEIPANAVGGERTDPGTSWAATSVASPSTTTTPRSNFGRSPLLVLNPVLAPAGPPERSGLFSHSSPINAAHEEHKKPPC